MSFIGLLYKEMNLGRNSKITLTELNSYIYILFDLYIWVIRVNIYKQNNNFTIHFNLLTISVSHEEN